ncbi:hypothetical protein Q5P01_010866 [Channa striata]|uniref:Uncharacterized protein n=1 Tax=Channa striata TaxID=64152 RepID=A0AA88MWB0_CHASR|nr:hypothetical protein Q5P01_010866 [Channa striata]
MPVTQNSQEDMGGAGYMLLYAMTIFTMSPHSKLAADYDFPYRSSPQVTDLLRPPENTAPTSPDQLCPEDSHNKRTAGPISQQRGVKKSEQRVECFFSALENHLLLFYVSSATFYTDPDKVWPFSVPALLLRPISCSLCRLSAGCGANIRAASLAGRPNQTLEAGLIGLTYSIKPSIKPPLTIHWGLAASDIAE